MAKVKKTFDKDIGNMLEESTSKLEEVKEDVDKKADPIVPVVEEKPEKLEKPEWPKKHVCRIKRWVSSKSQMYFPGDVVEFGEREFIPSGFDLID